MKNLLLALALLLSVTFAAQAANEPVINTFNEPITSLMPYQVSELEDPEDDCIVIIADGDITIRITIDEITVDFEVPITIIIIICDEEDEK